MAELVRLSITHYHHFVTSFTDYILDLSMISVVRAKENDFRLLAEIGRRTFLASHGHSASIEIINRYLENKFNDDACQEELKDLKNIYHIIYYKQIPAGYSKIIFDAPEENIDVKNVTKLERLYLLQEFYSLKLGWELLKFNIELSKTQDQVGMWLFVWKENHKAVHFYSKAGFAVIGSYDFKLTENHSNPNHQMLLRY